MSAKYFPMELLERLYVQGGQDARDQRYTPCFFVSAMVVDLEELRDSLGTATTLERVRERLYNRLWNSGITAMFLPTPASVMADDSDALPLTLVYEGWVPLKLLVAALEQIGVECPADSEGYRWLPPGCQSTGWPGDFMVDVQPT